MTEIVLEGSGKNALSTELMTRTLRAVRAARGTPILLRGEGTAFSAGLHLKELSTLDRAGIETYLGVLDELVLALFHHDAPMVACINGHAIAGGCVLALTCDLRVATSAPGTKIGLNEVALGLEFPPRILRLVRARVGRAQQRRVLLEAGLYAPEEALRLGLVDEVADDPLAVAQRRLAVLAGHPLDAYAATKRALTDGALDLSAAEEAAWTQRILPRWASEETKNSILRALTR